MKTVKYNEAEKLVHRYIERFTNLRIRNNREFFNVKPEEALEIFKEVAMLLDDAEIREYDKQIGKNADIVSTTISSKTKSIKNEVGNKVWLIPYNKKYFDLKGCYEKIGEVYWTQHCNFQPGDTGYIYGSAPESAIRFSFEILESYVLYDPIMDKEDEFVKSGGETNEDVGKKKLFAHMKLTGETTNRRLSLVNLLDRGLKAAPMGALILSKPELKDLLIYIHENF